MDGSRKLQHQDAPLIVSASKRERFFASYFWLILKNVVGWLLILAAFVAGPLIPGPGGIPLFLIGFALVTLPGKRRLTARVLRGRPVHFRKRRFLLISLSVALALPALVLSLALRQSRWLSEVRAQRPATIILTYLSSVAITWLLVRLTPHALNLILRIAAKARKRSRPWLRRHRIHLLPPRWRRRRAHETGSGPFRLKDEILKLHKRHPL